MSLGWGRVVLVTWFPNSGGLHPERWHASSSHVPFLIGVDWDTLHGHDSQARLY